MRFCRCGVWVITAVALDINPIVTERRPGNTRSKFWATVNYFAFLLRPPALAVSSTEDRVQDVRARIQVFTSVKHPSTSPTSLSQQLPHGVTCVQQCKAISSSRTVAQSDVDKKSFAYSGPALWNPLPLTARDPSLSPTQFCAQLKSVVFSGAQWYIFIAPPWQSRL